MHGSLNASTRATLSQRFIHGNERNRIALTSDGAFITASSGSSVPFWDARTHDQIGSAIEHTGKVECMTISTNDTVIDSDERITRGSLSHRTNMHTILSYLSVVFPAFKIRMVGGTEEFAVSASTKEHGERRCRQSMCPTRIARASWFSRFIQLRPVVKWMGQTVLCARKGIRIAPKVNSVTREYLHTNKVKIQRMEMYRNGEETFRSWSQTRVGPTLVK